MKYEIVSFADIFSFNNGKAVKALEQGEYPVYGSNGILGYSNQYLYSDSIIIGRVGAYCGSVMRCKESFWASDNTLVVDVDENIADKQFCYYMLQTLHLNNYAGGSAQPLITQTILRKINCPLPPLHKQIKIGKILATYDNLIENNQKQIKLLEEMAQRLYKEWFIDLHFPGYENVPVVDGVPEGWDNTTIGELSYVLKRGISPKYNDDAEFYVINQKCIRQTVMSIDEARRQEKTYNEELNLRDNDTVICSTGSGTLGRVGQVFGDYPNTTFDSHVTLVRAKENVGFQFLFQTIKSNQSYLMGMGKGSTNQQELSRDTIKDIKVVLPDINTMKKFESLQQPIHDKVRILRDEIINLQAARDNLLPKLMNGEIEV